MAEGISVKPGFFRLRLDLYTTQAHAQSRIKSFKQKLHTRTHGMDVAILNLLGMSYYSIRQVGDALESFQRALEIDPDSINSLENIGHIYELLGRNKDAREARQRVQKNLSDLLAQARCLAEQGYAMNFMYKEDDEVESWRQSVQHYRQAITLGQTKAQHNETASWYYGVAGNMSEICYSLFTEGALIQTDYIECLEACLEAHQLTRDSDGDKTICAISLLLLSTFRSEPLLEDCPAVNQLVKKYNVDLYYDYPEESFKKAIELDPGNPDCYTDYADFMLNNFYKDKENNQESYKIAMDLLNGYIDRHGSLDKVPTIAATDPVNDVLAPLLTRGETYVQMYEDSYDDNVQNLLTAYQDFTWALKIERTSDTLAKLGDVCHLIAMHPFTALPSRDIQLLSGPARESYTKYMNKALTYFLDATMCEEDDTEAYLHYEYARCLADYGEQRAAVESYKRALELGDGTPLKSFKGLVQSLSQLYQDNDQTEDLLAELPFCRPENRIAELAFESFKGLVESLSQLYEENDNSQDLMAELAFWLDYIVIAYGQQCENVTETLEFMFQEHKGIMKTVLYQLAYQKKSETLKMCLDFHDDLEEAKKLLDLSQQESLDNTQLSSTSRLSAPATPNYPTSKPPGIQPSNESAHDHTTETSTIPCEEVDETRCDVDEPLVPEAISNAKVQFEIKSASGLPYGDREESHALTESSITSEVTANQSRQSVDPLVSSEFPIEASDTLGEVLAIPREASVILGEASTIPGEASTIPGEASAIPRKESAIPTEGSAIPEETSAILRKGPAIPTEGSAIPEETSAILRKESAIPTEGSAIPGEGSAIPAEASAIPTEASDTPEEASAIPGEGSATPAEASAIRREELDITREEPAIPRQGSTIIGEASADITENVNVVPEASSSNQSHSKLIQSIPPPLSQAKNQHGKIFDFFVSFSTKDAGWVYHSLLPKLEKQSKFKGCIADRDYMLGESIFENMELSFDQSVCTILAITQNFVDSKFCKHEIDQALLRWRKDGHKVIPIKLEECDVPPKIAALTYLDATHYMDWDRLLRNLDICCNKEKHI